jgi:hypothetical protein
MNKVNARLRYGLLQGTAVIAPVALAAALMPLRGHISTTNVALLMVVAVAPVAFGSRVAGIVAALSAAEELASEQAALRRVATLVAKGIPEEGLRRRS